MAWKQKLQTTRNALNKNAELAIVFDSAGPAPEGFVDSVKSQYPFVDDEYLRFLQTTDGLQIDMFVLFGSGQSSFPSIEKLIKAWEPELSARECIPIGEDPNGWCIALNNEGSVILVHYETDSPTPDPIIAKSFGEFLDQVLMGVDFPKLFSSGHENEWTAHMREQGWL